MYENYYDRGVEAYLSGKTEHESNLIDDDERDAWLDGWNDARHNHHLA